MPENAALSSCLIFYVCIVFSLRLVIKVHKRKYMFEIHWRYIHIILRCILPIGQMVRNKLKCFTVLRAVVRVNQHSSSMDSQWRYKHQELWYRLLAITLDMVWWDNRWPR